MTHDEYWNEIDSITRSMAEEALSDAGGDIDTARDDIWDSRLHETIDGHQWVIYYAYNLDVIRISDNEDYYESNFGADDIAATLKSGGIDQLHTIMAFWCMYADVADRIEDVLTELAEQQETA